MNDKTAPIRERTSRIEELNGRFLTADEMIKLTPLAHPRGKDGGWGR